MSIRIENLNKRFGAQVVLDRISLEVSEGELFVLLGASGYSVQALTAASFHALATADNSSLCSRATRGSP